MPGITAFDVDAIRGEVCLANIRLAELGLAHLTWGNVSAFQRREELVVIKPSGIPYSQLDAQSMVVVDLKGQVVEGDLRPSIDTETHLVLYRTFPSLGAIVHAHSVYATAFCQARLPITCLGTTHSDHFRGTVPVTRELTPSELADNYGEATGRSITELFRERDPLEVPAALVSGHGPFAWGRSVCEAMDNAVALEVIAQIAYVTRQLDPDARGIGHELRDRHFLRKHGPEARYGQDGF